MIKTLYTFIFSVLTFITYAQIPAYYSDVDLTLSGMALKSELANKITVTHTSPTTYTQAWTVLQQSDLAQSSSTNVYLIYGWDDTDTDITNDLTRDKNLTGGNSGEWNREHVFAKSLANPSLTTGSIGPGTDCHNLKPCDVERNGNMRGNKKFIAGSGIASAVISGGWFPGDEWRGDVARVIMYMYLRYDSQCKPAYVCVGNPVSSDLNMVDLLLTWNVVDPVSPHEITRNNVIYNNQGNRNPFIDNPYLATMIWGGVAAENTWAQYGVGVKESINLEFSLYPNPTDNGVFYLNFNNHNWVNSVTVFDITGKIVNTVEQNQINSNTYTISDLTTGVYFVKVATDANIITKKVIVK